MLTVQARDSDYDAHEWACRFHALERKRYCKNTTIKRSSAVVRNVCTAGYSDIINQTPASMANNELCV